MSRTSTQDAGRSDLDWVIDCDTHVTEPPDLFTSRLPAKWQDQAPRIRKNEEWIDAGLRDATPENRRKLLFDNAARLYRVDAPPGSAA